MKAFAYRGLCHGVCLPQFVQHLLTPVCVAALAYQGLYEGVCIPVFAYQRSLVFWSEVEVGSKYWGLMLNKV